MVGSAGGIASLISYPVLLAVGAHPFSSPSALGRALKTFMTRTEAGLALRSTDRATPVVLLALFMLLGSGLSALWSRVHIVGLVTAVLVAGLVVANNPSLFLGDTIANNFTISSGLGLLSAASCFDNIPFFTSATRA